MRLKIIAGNLVTLLTVGLVSYLYVGMRLSDELGRQVDARIDNDQDLLDRSLRLLASDFVRDTVDRAATRELKSTLNTSDPRNRAQRVYQQCESIAAWFRDPARGFQGPPDIVLVTDERGKVVARNKDVNAMHDVSIVGQVPAVAGVLEDGRSRHDVWLKHDENKVMHIATAPVRSEQGGLLGVLLVGYDLSNGMAQKISHVLESEVAFVTHDRVYSGSLNGDRAPFRTLRSENHGRAGEEALRGERSNAFRVDLRGQQYVVMLARLPAAPSTPVGYAVLSNRTQAMGLSSLSNMILLMTALGALVVVVYGFITGTQFLRPMEEIEDAVLAIINGNTDRRIDIKSSEFGGLAYRINQLVNLFTGVSEEDENGRVSSRGMPSVDPAGNWQGAAFQDGGEKAEKPSPASPNAPLDDPALSATLAAEPAEVYYNRVFGEYVAAKQAAGEDVSNIPQERFIKRLEANAKALAKRHGVASVRFQVARQGNQVILKPVLLR
ncbi:MAG: MXAN_5187 C-terminal domain-containing protein [Myxococcota bacterium]